MDKRTAVCKECGLNYATRRSELCPGCIKLGLPPTDKRCTSFSSYRRERCAQLKGHTDKHYNEGRTLYWV